MLKIVYNINYKYNLKILSSCFYPFETTCVLQTRLFKNKNEMSLEFEYLYQFLYTIRTIDGSHIPIMARSLDPT